MPRPRNRNGFSGQTGGRAGRALLLGLLTAVMLIVAGAGTDVFAAPPVASAGITARTGTDTGAIDQRIAQDRVDLRSAQAVLAQTQQALSDARSTGNTQATTLATQAVSLATQAVNKAEATLNTDIQARECAIRAGAESRYVEFKQRVAEDQQTIANFGFEQNASSIRAWGTLGQQAMDLAREKSRSMLAGAAMSAVIPGLKRTLSAGGALTASLSQRLIRLYQAEALPSSDRAWAAAHKVGETLSPEGIAAINSSLDRAGRTYETASAASEYAQGVAAGRDLDVASAMASLAGIYDPVFKLLSMDIDTVSMVTYGAEYAVARHRVSHLTTMTEGQLRELASVTKRLKVDVQSLQEADRSLHSTTCNSTTLVQGSP